MRCMCPNCGNMIESGSLSFDFTEYIRGRLEDQMKDVADSTITDGRDTLFYSWRAENPILLSEEKVLIYPKSAVQKDNIGMWIDFSIPVDLIQKKEINFDSMVDYDNQKVQAFMEWLEANKADLKSKIYSIRLDKNGHGDVEFDSIRGVTEERKCPFCNNVMSYWAGRYPEITLTVLGGPRVSKSTAVTACIYAFMDRRDDLIAIEGAHFDRGYKLFEEQCLEKYKKGLEIGATDNNKYTIPRVSFDVAIGRDNQKKHICLTFVDVPGELMGENGVNIRQMEEEKWGRILKNIDFVWYCTDPAEIQQMSSSTEVQQTFGYDEKHHVLKNDKLTRNMQNLALFLQRYDREIPVAFIMGKTDSNLIYHEDKEQFKLFKNGEDSSEIKLPVVVHEFYKRSKDVREYMARYNSDLVREFENNFERRCYIAMSAYGYNPKDYTEENVPQKRCYNCKEALYWMLAIRSCIDVRVDKVKRNIFGRERVETIDGKLALLEPNLLDKAYCELYMNDQIQRIM